MTSTTNPSAKLADSLAQFSKAAYNAFTEVENQSRIEVLRSASEAHTAREETREVRSERDKIARDLHAATLEVQGWKQEAADAKATLAQAQLTIVHQAENIESQHEIIAQLRREVSQWKDQSRNWQEHFLRVEQERCTQSSRIDELMKLQYARPVNTTSFFTPKQKYASATHPHAINSAPSSTTKGAVIPSPTQPPSYKSAAPLSASDTGSCSDASSPLPNDSKLENLGTTPKRQKDVPLVEEGPHTSVVVQDPNLSSSKRKTRNDNSNIAAASSSQRQDSQTPVVPRTTLIRRVQAVVHVKREESDDDSIEEISATTDIAKNQASDEDEIVTANQRHSSRRRSKRTIKSDEEDAEQNYLTADGNPVWESRHLRHRNTIPNYREDEDEDDEDELTMGAEKNHEEVYGTQRVETLDAQRSYPTSVVPPPLKKKRKLAAR